jgi:histidinol phosphatase-like PHP family hydrolase
MSESFAEGTVTIQHDLHIHTFLSKCCKTPWESFPEKIIARAAEAGLRTIGLADHLWDAGVAGATDWYAVQDFPYINQARRLLPPDLLGVRVLFGCETEMRGDGMACITPQVAERLDFVLMPHSHLHIKGILPPDCRTPQQIADFMVKRFLRSLEFGFVTGIPHAFVPGKHEGEADEIVACVSDGQLQDCFGKARERRVAIEITPNFFPSLKPEALRPYHDETYLRVLSAAKLAGCLFYLGSDAHTLDRVGSSKALHPFLMQLGITANDFHPLVR